MVTACTIALPSGFRCRFSEVKFRPVALADRPNHLGRHDVVERAADVAIDVRVPRNLPPRSGITPVSGRALSVAAPGQADTCKKGVAASAAH